MVDESAWSADELIISHPHVLPLTIYSMYNDYTHITIHKLHHIYQTQEATMLLKSDKSNYRLHFLSEYEV